MPKCPPFRQFLGKHKTFGKFWLRAGQTTACGRNDLSFALYLILNGKLDICERDDLALDFKEPVLLLRSENMVTLLSRFDHSSARRWFEPKINSLF